jgi:hypothetical protein
VAVEGHIEEDGRTRADVAGHQTGDYPRILVATGEPLVSGETASRSRQVSRIVLHGLAAATDDECRRAGRGQHAVRTFQYSHLFLFFT